MPTYRVSSPLFGNFLEGELPVVESKAEYLAQHLNASMTVYLIVPEVRDDKGKLVASEQQLLIKEFYPPSLVM